MNSEKQQWTWPGQQFIFLLSHRSLFVILIIFLSISILYSLIVPITQGEDELAHYRYISFIAQNGRLPINEAERKQAWYRADWPPLYHLLVGWTIGPLDTSRPHLKDVGESPRRRLVGEIFYPRLIIYTEDANWPWQDGILAWHIGRFISILFAAGALVLTYVTVSELNLEPKRILALAATALLAFTPRYLFTSAMLGDDSLFILLSTAFIWLLLRALRGDDRWRTYAGLGILLGLSITTKYSTGLLPLALIPVVWRRSDPAGWSLIQTWGRLGLAWLCTLLASSWWFGWIIYHFNTFKEDGLIFGLFRPLLASGPDVSMRRVYAFFAGGEFTGQERPDAIEAGAFGDWLTYLFQTFWSVPVLEHDPLFPWGYLPILLLCFAALIGLWRLWQTATPEVRTNIAVLGLIIGLLFPFPILRYFLTRNVLETGQGRHILYPAAQAIPILLVLGWMQISTLINRRMTLLTISHSSSTIKDYGSRLKDYILPIMLCLPLYLLLWSIFQLFYMITTYPAPLSVQTTTFNPASIPQPLKHNFGKDIRLLGYDFKPKLEQSIFDLTLFWRSLNLVEENYRIQVQLIDTAHQPRFTWLSHPINGLYPTRAWDKGDVVRDTLSFPLAAIPADTYKVQLNLLHEAEDVPLTKEPLQIVQFDLPNTLPIVGGAMIADKIHYRLWTNEAPAHYRQTLPLSWVELNDQPAVSQEPPHGTEVSSPNPQLPASKLTWALLGPDNIPRQPVAVADSTAIFMVGADWPSGPYRLLVQTSTEPYQTEALFIVANEARLFDLPPNLTSPETGWRSIEANFADQVKLLGYFLPTRRIEPGSGLPLTLYWQSLAPVLGDYIVFDVLLDENQQVYGGYDRLPREYYSTILWAKGEIVEDGFAVPVSPAAPPGIYNLHVGLYSQTANSLHSLPLIEAGQATDVTSVVLGPIKVGGPPPDVTIEDPNPQIKLNQTLASQITLLGYDIIDQKGQRWVGSEFQGETLKLVFYWQAEDSPAADYTTFLHLRDATNETITQQDNPPAAGRYPTSLWDRGEVIVDEISLSLVNVPPGRYTPVVGLYELATGNRLTTPDNPANEIPLNAILLP